MALRINMRSLVATTDLCLDIDCLSCDKNCLALVGLTTGWQMKYRWISNFSEIPYRFNYFDCYFLITVLL